MNPLRLSVVLAIASGLCTSCASQSGNDLSPPSSEIREMAKAALDLSNSVEPLLDISFRGSVKADTLVLKSTREVLVDSNARMAAITSSTEALRERAAVLASVKLHSRLLSRYFMALEDLAEASADSEFPHRESMIADQLAMLGQKLAGANLGGVRIYELLSPAVPVAVSGTAVRPLALQQELEARATMIAREINLQGTILSVVAENARQDRRIQIEEQDYSNVIQPFLESGPLPSNWDERRLTSLEPETSLDALDAAAAASRSMELAFIGFAEGRSERTLDIAIDNVAHVMSLVESLRNSPAEVGKIGPTE